MAPPSSFDFVVNRILPLIFCRFSRCFCRWKIIVVDIGTSGEGMDVSLVYSKFVSSRDESFISSGGKEFKLISHRSIVRKNYNCRMIVMILPSEQKLFKIRGYSMNVQRVVKSLGEYSLFIRSRGYFKRFLHSLVLQLFQN